MRQKGFTLIELMVVISIIGFLSSVVVASLSTARQRAKNTAISRSVKGYLDAIMAYYYEKGSLPQVGEPFWYPYSCLGTVAPGDMCFYDGLEDGTLQANLQPYIKSWQNPNPYIYEGIDSNGNPANFSGAMYYCATSNPDYSKCLTAEVYWIKDINAGCGIPKAVGGAGFDYCYIHLPMYQ